jgi:hypothetical protein
LAFVQAVPQVPQFVVVLRGTSQPFEASPSQLPNPALQAMPQEPEVHDGVPLVALQERPQPPQLVRLLLVSVSQPLPLLPSQSWNVPVHTGTHAPATHVVVPWAFEQTFPQAPQFVVLVWRFVSHPFAAFASQFPYPEKQVGLQVPPAQAFVPFAAVQTAPHAPQLVAFVVRFVSHPFAAFPSQLANPGLHDGAHEPAEQAVVPFAFVQADPHAPQFATLVWRLVSHPLAVVQSPKPESHAMAQLPAVQLAVPFVLLQVVPHAPQFATLVFVLTSQPLVDTPSQLA